MIGKKFKIKGGLLSDIVSPEELEKMTIAATEENKEETKPAETEPKTENSENDDASWKSRVSEPAAETTDDGNQGCKKASNQNEYADEIGLVEAEEIVTNLEDKVESGEIEDENSVEVVESMQDALTATEEVIEQKEIIDEATENNELTPTAVSIFKEQCENYLKEVNGVETSEDGEEVDYIESESAGLESDSQQQLKAKCDAIWNTTDKTVKEVFKSIRKTHELVAGLQFFGFSKKEIVNPFLSLDDQIYAERKTQINDILRQGRKDFISMLNSGNFNPLVKKDIGSAIVDLDHYLPDDKNAVAKKDLFINLFRIDVDMSKEFSDKSSKDEDYTYETFWDSTDGMLSKNIDRFVQKYQDKAPSVNGKKLNNFWLMDSTDHDVVSAYISLGEFFPEIEDEIVKWENGK